MTFGITQRVYRINRLPTAKLGKLVLTLGNRSLRSQTLHLELLAVAGIGNSNGNLKRIANMTRLEKFLKEVNAKSLAVEKVKNQLSKKNKLTIKKIFATL